MDRKQFTVLAAHAVASGVAGGVISGRVLPGTAAHAHDGGKAERVIRAESFGALAVDREAFAASVTDAIASSPDIWLLREEVREIPAEGIVVLAVGPLVSASLAQAIARFRGATTCIFSTPSRRSSSPTRSTAASSSRLRGTTRGAETTTSTAR